MNSVSGWGSLPKELWGKIFEYVDEPQNFSKASTLFREICKDQNMICSWLLNKLNSKGLFHISELLKGPQSLINIKIKVAARAASYRPPSTREFTRGIQPVLHAQGFAKLFREERAINLIHVYERVPLDNMPSFKDLELEAKARAISAFFEENKERLAGIEKLNLCNIYLTAVPEELKLFTGLKELNLCANLIDFIPDTWGTVWKQLEKCDLSINTRLKKIPDNLKKFL